MFRSHLLYITVAVVVYIGVSSQYGSCSLVWTIPRYRIFYVDWRILEFSMSQDIVGPLDRYRVLSWHIL